MHLSNKIQHLSLLTYTNTHTYTHPHAPNTHTHTHPTHTRTIYTQHTHTHTHTAHLHIYLNIIFIITMYSNLNTFKNIFILHNMLIAQISKGVSLAQLISWDQQASDTTYVRQCGNTIRKTPTEITYRNTIQKWPMEILNSNT